MPETWDDATQERTVEALLEVAGEVGFETLQQWVSGGQYGHETGLFYGGTGPVWSHEILEVLAGGALAGRSSVAMVDLHTGLGPWGVGELISSEAPESAAHRRAIAWYGDDVTSLVAGDSVSADLSGEWLPAVGALLDVRRGHCSGARVRHGRLADRRCRRCEPTRGCTPTATRPVPLLPPSRPPCGRRSPMTDPAWIAELHDRFTSVLDRAMNGVS